SKDQILTNCAALLPFEAVSCTDDVATDAGFLSSLKYRARHTDGTCHFTIHRDSLGGSHQVTVHFAVDGNALREDNQIAIDRPIQHKLLCANIKVIIHHFARLDDHFVAAASVKCI